VWKQSPEKIALLHLENPPKVLRSERSTIRWVPVLTKLGLQRTQGLALAACRVSDKALSHPFPQTTADLPGSFLGLRGPDMIVGNG
jgi:hypothetical protein